MRARIRRVLFDLRWALGYAGFGVGCAFLDLVWLPLQRRLASGDAPDLRAQRSFHQAAGRYLDFLSAIGAVHFHVEGGERLRDGPQLIVANHPALLDFVLLCALMPQADCIVSSAWTRAFPLRGLANAAGHLRDDDPAGLVRECVERLQKGRSVVVFPEGTRSPADGLGPFQRLAARIALQAGCDLRPVLITWDPSVLYKGAPWSELPERPIHATVRVLDPIRLDAAPVAGETGESRVSLSVASRNLMSELRDFFLEGLGLQELDSEDVGGPEGDDVRNA